MARSIEYWYNVMIAEKNTYSNLNGYQPTIDDAQTLITDLKSTSKVARWRIAFWVVATCAYAVDVIHDLAIITMEALAAKSRYGTLPWYVTVAKEFQYGDALVLIDDEWKYATINDANKRVKLAAAQEGPGIVNLKIANIISGVKQPILTAEYNAFVAYVNKKKPAGITINVINALADDLSLQLTVNYDPLVLTSTGELINTPGLFPVMDAIALYLESLDFNGGFELMSLVDFVQAQKNKGVVSAYVTGASARYGANLFVPFPQRYFPNSGYLTLHSSSVITYNAI